MTKEAGKNAVALETKNPLALMPSFMDASDLEAGFEGADSDSYAIPFIQVLQKMSPLVDEDKPQYIPGAKSGMFYNTVTKKLYDGKSGLKFIPCAFKRSFILWGPRDAGGGFKGEFTPEQIDAMLHDAIGKPQVVSVEGRLFKPLPDGTVDEKRCDYYADTRSHYILMQDEATGETGQAILSLTGTLTKSSKMLLTALQQKKIEGPRGKATPPTFANVVKLTTVGMSNEKGSWSGVSFELDGLVSDPMLYAEAKAFYKAITSGEVKADYSKSESAQPDVSNTPQEAEGF
jgi:hypothetical protein